MIKVGDRVRIVNKNSSWHGDEGFVRSIFSSDFIQYESTDDVKQILPSLRFSLGGINDDGQISSWTPDWKETDIVVIDVFTEKYKEDIYKTINFKELI